MSIFNVFSLMGGLALFMYGMDVMGKALEKAAGSKLTKAQTLGVPVIDEAEFFKLIKQDRSVEDGN